MMVLMLNIDMEFINGILFVRVNGSLKKTTINIFNDKLIPLIKDSGIKNLVYNFDNLICIDEDGFNSLLNTYNEILNNNGNLLVVNNKFKLKYFKEVNNELSALKILKI